MSRTRRHDSERIFSGDGSGFRDGTSFFSAFEIVCRDGIMDGDVCGVALSEAYIYQVHTHIHIYIYIYIYTD